MVFDPAIAEHLRDRLPQSRLGNWHRLMLGRVQVDLRPVTDASLPKERLHEECGFVRSRRTLNGIEVTSTPTLPPEKLSSAFRM